MYRFALGSTSLYYVCSVDRCVISVYILVMVYIVPCDIESCIHSLDVEFNLVYKVVKYAEHCIEKAHARNEMPKVASVYLLACYSLSVYKIFSKFSVSFWPPPHHHLSVSICFCNFALYALCLRSNCMRVCVCARFTIWL